jgi:amino-acid N-acetyltransferase
VKSEHAGSPAAGCAVTLRPARMADVEGIFTLIDEASRTTTVLPRSRESIGERLRDFFVAEREGRVAGCGALVLFSQVLAEIRSLVVAPELRGMRIGGLLVEGLIGEARRLGVRRVFALTDNPPFFVRLGFRAVDKMTLPQKVWTDCVRCEKYLNCTEQAVDIMIPPPLPPLSESKS